MIQITSKRIFPIFFIQFFILGFGLAIVGPLIPVLADFFKVRLDVIGTVLSMNAFGILLATLFSGIIAERFGKKNILIAGCILLTGSFLSIYFSSNLILFTTGYVIFGLSLGMVQVNAISIISDFYILNKSKMLLRIMIGLSLGNFAVPGIVSIVLLKNISWKYIFLSIALLNTILLIIIVAFKILGTGKMQEKENFKNLFTANKKFFSSPIVILCGAIAFLHYGTGWAFSSWFTTYFKGQNVSVSTSSLLLTIYLFVFGMSMFLKSFVFTRFDEKKVMQYSSLLAFIFLFISIFINQMTAKFILFLFFGFSFAGVGALALAAAMKQHQSYSGSLTSIISGYGWTGVVVLQYVTGYLTEKFSASSMIYVSLAAVFLMLVFTSLLIYNIKS